MSIATEADVFSVLTPGRTRLALAAFVVLNHMTRIDSGSIAVCAFFVLSGFWIQRIWVSRYSIADRPYLTFVASRAARLWPTFWLCNALAIAVACYVVGEPGIFKGGVASDIHAVGSNLFVLGFNGLPSTAVKLGPAWSLDTEMQFYLIAPFLIAAVSGSLERNAIYIALSLVGIVGWSLLFLGNKELPSIFLYFEFFFAGITAAHARWKPSVRLQFASAALISVMIVAVLAWPPLQPLILTANHVDETALSVFQLAGKPMFQALVPVVAIPLILGSVWRQSNKFDSMCGDLSYIVYLLHAPMIAVYGSLLRPGGPLALKAVFAICTLSALIFTSCLIWRYFHQPLEAFRQRFLHRMTEGERTHPVDLKGTPCAH